MAEAEPQPPRGPPPNLSRVQVYLYALLALFGGVLFAGSVRSVTGAVARDRALLLLVAAGILLGGALALAAIVLVVRTMRGLPPDRRYRIARLHTVALTAVVLAFLAVASLRPSLIAPAPEQGTFIVPTNVTAVPPLAAALTTLLALGIAYRRLNRSPG